MKIFLTSKADKQLKKLPPKMYEVILEKIELLGTNPFPTGSKKLIDREGWRIRIGDYRILYTVEYKKGELTVLSIAHRKEAYRF
ncbi:type II toxin-antitoxin system RelE/ParE family toxin [Candidatus Roizmanbacteria bacterium]|nr:type II toxin-antitoxin system RelE/ParE family toxin [Candidatus Roizmanbacteria bacterium]